MQDVILAGMRKISRLLVYEELSNGRVTKLLKRAGVSVCPSLKFHTSRRRILQALNFQLLFSIVLAPSTLTVMDVIGTVAYNIAANNQWFEYLLKKSQEECFCKLKKADIFHSTVKTLVKESEQYKFPIALVSSGLIKYLAQKQPENTMSLFSIIALISEKNTQQLAKTLVEVPSKIYILRDFVFVDDISNSSEQRELVILEEPVLELETLITTAKLSLI